MNPKDQTPVARLSPADAQALEAIIEALAASPHTTDEHPSDHPSSQFIPTSSDSPLRTQKIQSLLNLISQCPTQDPPSDLVARTMTRITQERQRLRFSHQIQTLSSPPLAFRWREFLSVAAVLVLSLSLGWPMLAQSSTEARKIACGNNLAAAGIAMSRYASDNNGLMPRLQTQARSPWNIVGKGATPEGFVQSNPAHLYVLVRRGYVDANTLACPENANAPQNMTASMVDWPRTEAVSYSYQNQYRPAPLRLDRTPQLAILADKNPLFVPCATDPCRVIYRQDLPPTSPSNLHQQKGQNILAAAGAVTWTAKPILPNGDNIWLASGVQDYAGTETTTQPDDSFLAP